MAVGAGVSIIGGAVKANQAKGAASKARVKALAAQKDLDEQKDRFKNLDTSNPYLNMENVMEDLTVNTQASEFERDQQMSSQANIMTQMRGAAGSSGIGALAQTLASQGSMDAQKSSASIAQQEQANTMAERTESGRIQGLEREGELISRNAQAGKIGSLMGMAADDVSVQRSAEQLAMQQKQAAQQQMISGAAQAGMGAAVGISQTRFKNGKGSGNIDVNMLNEFKSMQGVGGVGIDMQNLTPAQIKQYELLLAQSKGQ